MASVKVQSAGSVPDPPYPIQSQVGNYVPLKLESTGAVDNGLSGFQIVSNGSSVILQEPYTSEAVFPLTLSPINGVAINDYITSTEYLTSSGKIRELLDAHGGAILFKDLGLQSAEQFSQFARAFGWTPHEDIGNPVRRTVLAFNVATANEGPNTSPVYPHNERLKEIVPEFLDELAEKGVKYQLFYPNKPRADISSAGTSLLQSYGLHVLDTDNVDVAREKIETEIRRLPTATWSWENCSETNQLGDLRVWQILPALRLHNRTGRTSFFNNMISRFLNAQAAGTLEPPHINKDGKYQPPAFYGDGTEIPQHYLEAAVNIIKETRALITWKTGDVILLDNLAVQHAREPWTGPRKLLASLWDE